MILNYKFKDKDLFDQAMTHSSSVKDKILSNERLEFLGDRVLSLCLSTYLFSTYTSDSEGDLAKRHALFACADTLYQIAKNIHLDDTIKTSFVINSESKHDKNVLADAVEALIGAIYLDSDFDTVYKFVISLYDNLLIDLQKKVPQDFKTQLQELTQAKYHQIPIYEIISVKGPDHNPEFNVKVSIQTFVAYGCGTSKKLAEQNAAKNLLEQIII